MDNYVEVAIFSNEVEAELAQATLAAAGIESFLKYEDVGGMLPALQESRGVRVLVDKDRSDEARTVLTTTASSDAI